MVSADLQFVTKNDQIPERDESFVFELLIVKGSPKAVVDTPNRITVTILANDDAFGIFGFSTVSKT